jgi:hypothetical protein
VHETARCIGSPSDSRPTVLLTRATAEAPTVLSPCVHTRYIQYIHICIDPKVRKHFCKLHECVCISMHMCMYDVCISVHMCMYLHVLYGSCLYVTPSKVCCKKIHTICTTYARYAKICTRYKSTYNTYTYRPHMD